MRYLVEHWRAVRCSVVRLALAFTLLGACLPALFESLLGGLVVLGALLLVELVSLFPFIFPGIGVGGVTRQVGVLLQAAEDAASTIELTEVLKVASSVATRMNQSSWIDSTPP